MKMHTDNGFTFDIKEDHATVMEIDGDPQIVEIPEQIDGVPVTELAEYLFSGKVPVCCPAGQRAGLCHRIYCSTFYPRRKWQSAAE